MRLLWICAMVAACHGGEDKRPPDGKRVQITYDLDLDKAVDDRGAEVKRDLEAQLAERKIDARVRLVATTPGAVTVIPGDPAQLPALTELIESTYRDTLTRRDCAEPHAICFDLAIVDAIKKAALARAAEIVRARLGAFGVSDMKVTTKGLQLAVDLPGMSIDQLTRLREMVARPAALTFDIVDNDAPYMKKMFEHVGIEKAGGATDPAAQTAEIQVDIDQWRPEAPGPVQRDYYLIAHDRSMSVSPEEAHQLHCLRPESCLVTGRSAIERYVHELARTDPSFALPDDRKLAYERIEPAPEAKDRRPYWRSYYVERPAALTGASISNASAVVDPDAHQSVQIEFDRNGTTAFGDLTARITGKKLAIVLDGTVRSAPIINGPIRGGRASITLGAKARERDAADLALMLKLGALPAPMVEASFSPLGEPSLVKSP